MARNKGFSAAVVAGIGVLGLVSSRAFAAEISGWERPIYKAQMSVAAGSSEPGFAPQNVELVMTQEDGRQSPTGLVLLIDGETTQYEIRQTSEDRCGGAKYVATPMLTSTEPCGGESEPARCHGPVMGVQASSLVLQVKQDGSCLVPRNGHVTWQAALTESDQGTVNLVGSPEEMFSIEN